MRTLAFLLCLTAFGCSNSLKVTDDINLYCESRIYKPIMIPVQMAKDHPRICKQLIRAAQKWELAAPVEMPVTYSDVPFGRFLGVDISTPSNPIAAALYLGFYSAAESKLFLNEKIEDEKFSDDSIYKTCLHELGHFLGLPHIVGKLNEKGEKTFSGGGETDIVLPTDQEARRYIMYPMSSDDTQTDISDLEILWVRHALMHDLNLLKSPRGCEYEEAITQSSKN